MKSPAPSAREAQVARSVLMLRPACFGFNRQTAPSNAFQQSPGGTDGAMPEAGSQALALREFAGLEDLLRGAGIEVIVALDTDSPLKPDAVFPNNWLSFHADGTVVLYPMLAANRRAERRPEVIAQVIRQGAFRVVRTVDLAYRELEGKYLEGTGSLVLDRPARVAYASLSPRTDLDVLGEFAQQLDYELVTFEAFGANDQAIYHTNVLMAIGADFAVVCGAVIREPMHRRAVFSMLESAGHRIIEISPAQLYAYAGNLLALAGAAGPAIALSTTAWDALDAVQRRALEQHGAILAAEIPTIERIGGGGVRCMLAEIHLPKRSAAPRARDH